MQSRPRGASHRLRDEPSKFTWRLSAIAGAVTAPRVRRYHQMGAAVGWLQRISGRPEEGRVSQPGLKGNLSWSEEGVEYPSQKWVAAALRRRSGFPWIARPLFLFQ